MSPRVTRRSFLLDVGLTAIAAKRVTAAEPEPAFKLAPAQRHFHERGTGKTTRMVDAAMRRCAAEPGRHELLLAATSDSSVSIVEPILLHLAAQHHGCSYRRPHRLLTFANGSSIRLDAANQDFRRHLSCVYQGISLDHAAPVPSDWDLLQTRVRP